MDQHCIYKYHLPLADEIEIEIPSGATLLSVGQQREALYAWAIVNPSAPSRKILFHVIGTGTPMPRDLITSLHLGATRFICTVQMSFVWHVFVTTQHLFVPEGGQ
jgi:hypothetical protein